MKAIINFASRIQAILSHRLTLWVLIVVYGLLKIYDLRVVDQNYKAAIQSDGTGYYAYLPSLFLNNGKDKIFAWKEEAYFDTDLNKFGVNTLDNGNKINKYYIGTALCNLPAFAIAETLNSFTDSSVRGYSNYNYLSVCVSALIFGLIGIYFLQRLLLLFNFSYNIAAIISVLVLFGTNLYAYIFLEPSMSHAYSFAMITIFVYSCAVIFNSPSVKFSTVLLCGFSFALLFLIRPFNVLIILITPALAPSLNHYFSTIRSLLFSNRILGFALPILAGILLQSLAFYQQVGHWWYDGYIGEYFYFTNPKIFNNVLSWRKGWLIYTPIMLFALAGIVLIKPNHRKVFFAIYILSLVYTVSSWCMWTYGGSLGQRPYVDHYAVLAIPLAYGIVRIMNGVRLVKYSFATLTIAFVVINLVQSKQYAMSILPYDNMTWQKYRHLFMQTGREFIGLYSSTKMPTKPIHTSELVESVLLYRNDTIFLNGNMHRKENQPKVFRFKVSDGLTCDSCATAEPLRLAIEHVFTQHSNYSDKSYALEYWNNKDLVYWKEYFLLQPDTVPKTKISTIMYAELPIPALQDSIGLHYIGKPSMGIEIHEVRLHFLKPEKK